jgi:PilZ domain
VELDFSMIKARIAEAADQADRRRTSRHPVEVDAKVRELGASGVEARVINLSATGFMAEAAGDFEVGARVWLILPGRERANAVVKWVAAGKIGAEFAEPFPVESFRA